MNAGRPSVWVELAYQTPGARSPRVERAPMCRPPSKTRPCRADPPPGQRDLSVPSPLRRPGEQPEHRGQCFIARPPAKPGHPDHTWAGANDKFDNNREPTHHATRQGGQDAYWCQVQQRPKAVAAPGPSSPNTSVRPGGATQDTAAAAVTTSVGLVLGSQLMSSAAAACHLGQDRIRDGLAERIRHAGCRPADAPSDGAARGHGAERDQGAGRSCCGRRWESMFGLDPAPVAGDGRSRAPHGDLVMTVVCPDPPDRSERECNRTPCRR